MIIEKVCKGCGTKFKAKKRKNARMYCSHQCYVVWQRHQPGYMKKHIASCAKYEKTPNGFLMRMYRNMKSRVSGIQKLKRHLYEGKYLLPKEEFYAWAKNHPQFKKLFKDYEDSGYKQRLAPSVDRVDSSKGYRLENMEWVTQSENSRRGNENRNKARRKKI